MQGNLRRQPTPAHKLSLESENESSHPGTFSLVHGWLFVGPGKYSKQYSKQYISAAGPESNEKAKPQISAAAEVVLRAEAAGQPVDRRSLASDANNDYSHWMSGSLKIDKTWSRFDELDAAQESKLLAAYRQQRDEQKLDAEGHRRLARWCMKNELEPQAIAHWTAVTDSLPNDFEARYHLGHSWISGDWYSQAQLAQADAQLKQLMQDLREWLVPCQKIVKALSSNNAGAQRRRLRISKNRRSIAVAALELACYELDEASTGPIIEAIAKFESPAACMALPASRWLVLKRNAVSWRSPSLKIIPKICMCLSC